MGISRLCFGLLVLLALAVQAQAIETTTELGITITADQVIESMLEMEGFWPPVRAYIASERFQAADAATRKGSVDLLKQLDKMLSARLASDDNEVGEDLARYMAARLRKYECYRQLRTIVADDALTIRLKGVWEAGIDGCACEPGHERDRQVSALLKRIAGEMESAGLTSEQQNQAIQIWERLAQAKACIHQTAAGQAVREFELGVEKVSRNLSTLTFAVLDATEWALIVKPENTNVTRKDFVTAWESIASAHSSATRSAAGR